MIAKTTAPQLPPPKFSLWEILITIVGAIVILSTGALGLGAKFMMHASQDQRVQSIANNIMGYQIPGGAQGQFGINLAGAKVAVLGNRQQGVKLLVARVPVDEGTDKRQLEQALETAFLARIEAAFAESSSRTETRSLCGSKVPVQVTEGQLSAPDYSSAEPAIQYKASAAIADRRYVVRLVVRGQNAKPKAEKIFASLSCKSPQ
jgi:hypothetical protein